METSPIYELLPAFKERNQVIFMLLGLLSVSQDWMYLLESQVDRTRLHETDLNSPRMDRSGLDTSTRGFLYFLLGTVSFTGHFTRVLEDARTDGHLAPQSGSPGPSWGDINELLR